MPANGPPSPCLESKNAVTVISSHSQSPRTPQKPPLVTIHSPRSTVSSPRSPRLTGLLDALKDVIGEEPDGEYSSEEEATYVEEPPLNKCGDTLEYTTVIDINHSLPNFEQTSTESSGSPPANSDLFLNDENETLRSPLPVPETEPHLTIHTIQSSPVTSLPHSPPSHLLSPVDLAHLHLGSFAQEGPETIADEDDPSATSYADAWKRNSRSSMSPLQSTFGVLSSPLATASSRVLSPRLSAFISRPPSSPFGPVAVIDDNDVPPDMSLDSPSDHSFMYPEPQPEPSEAYVVVEPEAFVVTGEAVVEDEFEDEPNLDGDGSEDEEDRLEFEDDNKKVVELELEGDGSEANSENDGDRLVLDDNEDDTDVGHNSAVSWEHNVDPTAVFLGMPPVTLQEVRGALQRATMTPVHFLADTIDFDEGEAVANSSMIIPLDDSFSEDLLDAAEPDYSELIAASPLADSSMPEGLPESEVELAYSEPIAVSSRDEPSMLNDLAAGEVELDYSERIAVYPLVDSSMPEGLAGEAELDYREAIAVSSLDVSAADATYDSNSYLPDSSTDSQLPMHSSFDISRFSDDPEDHDEGLDETAELAYLHSPTIPYNENDTIHGLFLVGHSESFLVEDSESFLVGHSESFLVGDSESPVMESPLVTPLDDVSLDTAEIESSSGTTPVRSAFIRERVFTPPPNMPARGRSGTIIPAESPRSLPPPPPIPFSLPPKRPSPGSVWSPDSAVSEVQEAAVSKKVAFGFRKPLGQTNASSLASHRLSKRVSLAVQPPPPPPANVARAERPENTSPTSAPAAGLRPLRLSTILSTQPSSAPSRKTVFSVNSYRSSRNSHRASLSSTSVLSDCSYSRNPLLLSSNRASVIPEHVRNTQFTTDDIPSPLSSIHIRRLTTFSTLGDSPQSAALDRPLSWQSNPIADLSELSAFTQNDDTFHRPFSRASEPSYIYEEDEEEQDDTSQDNEEDHVIRRSLPAVPNSAPIDHRASVARSSMFTVAAPKPTLMFAIASDDVMQVRRVLESGDAGPNDAVGPQSALEFALTNEQLTHKMEIVKTLLAFGADPKVVVQPADSPNGAHGGTDGMDTSSPSNLMDALDPATRYYVEKADASHTRRTSALIHRSFFRPLTRVRYELIGQDRALEQLFKDLSMHSRQLSVTPIVVLLCGPSGHGKSLLARKSVLPLLVGALLDVPTHTVDMTTIRSAQDLWKSYSMSPYDPPSTRSLAEFLCDNEGKRCVVVLDEIEKTHGESSLWALLMPWEHGRCTFEAHGRLVDVRNVVWLSTSNIGQEVVFEHHNARALPDELMSKAEYTELMALLRPRVSERLGTSILSRVTTALPFVPFTPEERRAICYEALHTIAGDIIPTLSTDVVDSMVKGALADYTASEGARSLYRAVSNQLMYYVYVEILGALFSQLRLPSPTLQTVLRLLTFVFLTFVMKSTMQRRSHALKRLNRLEQRATETTAEQSASPSASATLASSLPPKSVPALAAVLSVIGAAIILGIAICRYRSYKRRKARASPNTLAGKVIIEKDHHYASEKHIDLADVSIYTEKPEKAVLTPRALDSETNWVPQIKAYPATSLPPPEPTASPKSKKSPKVILSVNTSPETPQSPPPVYFMADRAPGEAQSSIPIPPSPIVSTISPPPPTPPANRRTKSSFASQIEQPMPAPSPRSESFAPQDLVYPKEPGDSPSDESNQKLPRLMSVTSSFTPTLDDELAIKLGDTVRMLDEYKDGWCLVQRVGRIDAPKGAVPRFCLQERRGVVPIVPNRKFSNGSLKSSGWR
ncbi:hypothetical protein C0991_007422 [Blastosporella zonata]|nr:hypothetical protein C0991_007422 [Blastosporella zonata]